MGKDSFYETFDSSGGPTVPDSCEKDMANRDSDLKANGDDGVEHGAVPEMPQKSR